MDVNNYFDHFYDLEAKIQDLKILEFINHLDIKKCSELKDVSGWRELSDSALKKKIYNKVYYLEKKGPVEESEVSVTSLKANQAELKEEGDRAKLVVQLVSYLIVIIFSLSFLMYESAQFYRSYSFTTVNIILLPIIVELSILLLSLGSDLRSKVLMLLLILFNIVSFSFFSVSSYEKDAAYITKQVTSKNFLLSEQANANKRYEEVSKELEIARSLYEKAIKNKYYTKANNLYVPRINLLKQERTEASRVLKKVEEDLSRVKISNSKEILLVGVTALIFLKVILQLVVISFLGKFKSLAIKLRKEKRK